VITHDTAIALLVADEDGWHVTGGRSLRPNEWRSVVPHDHWLARRVSGTESAVIVSGTDVARQELHSVPLIHLENWLATTAPDVPALIVLGRAAEPPFSLRDAFEVREAARPHIAELEHALLLQQLARRLDEGQHA
jgi:hypothetical protein